jgi:imidazolonepropionase-like amidohydrolase
MNHLTRTVGLTLVVCCGGCAAGGGPSAASTLVAGDLWIRDVTVVSSERTAPLPHANVVVRGGRIASVGVESPGTATAGITVVDGSGRFLTPGLIDGHVHLAELPGMSPAQIASKPALATAYFSQVPRSYLYFGFTTVVDLNVVDRARVNAIRNAELGPAVFDCGNALTNVNGYFMAYLPPAERFERSPNFLYDPRLANSIPKQYLPEEHSPEAAVTRVANGGGRCVKSAYESGYGDLAGKLAVPSVELMREVRDASHRHHLPLLLHANSFESHRFAVEVGADAVAHGMLSGEGVETATELPQKARDILDAEQRAGMGYMPTSRLLSGLADLFSPEFLDDARMSRAVPADLVAWYRTDEGRWFAREIGGNGFFKGRPADQVRAMFGTVQQRGRATTYMAAHGGRIVFGSDTPAQPTYANPPGYNGYLELRELEGIGLSPRQILSAATMEAARLFQLEADYGIIAPGRVASLLLLRDDPTKSTAAFDTIETVIVKGRVVPRAKLSANTH